MWKMELWIWRGLLSCCPSKVGTPQTEQCTEYTAKKPHRVGKVCEDELIRAFLKSREELGNITDVAPGVHQV